MPVTRFDEVDDAAGVRQARPRRDEPATPATVSRVDHELAAVLLAHRVAPRSATAGCGREPCAHLLERVQPFGHLLGLGRIPRAHARLELVESPLLLVDQRRPGRLVARLEGAMEQVERVT